MAKALLATLAIVATVCIAGGYFYTHPDVQLPALGGTGTVHTTVRLARPWCLIVSHHVHALLII